MKTAAPPEDYRPTLAAMAVVLAVAFGLRIAGLDQLRLWGDAAYSVYAANRDLATIARERLSDGHPPLYYYLLHFWMLLAGTSEFSVRFLSVIPGLLVVALAYRVGTDLLGRSTGLAAAVLCGISPYLLYFARTPRMYPVMACLGLLGLLLLLRTRRGQRPALWLPYSVTLAAALYSHYYGVFLPLAYAPFALWRSSHKDLLWWLAATFAVGLLFLPWVGYALGSSTEATSAIINDAPSPPHLWALVQQLWLVLLASEFIHVKYAQLIGVGVTAIAVTAGLWWALRRVRGESSGLSPNLMLVALSVSLVVAATLPIFVVAPYLVRPRFFTLVQPLLLLALAGLLMSAARSVKLRVLAVGAVAVLLLWGTTVMYQNLPQVVESDAIQVTGLLQDYAEPTDAVLYHAFWQIGYLVSHSEPGWRPAAYPLREFGPSELAALLEQHPRLWLIMYHALPHSYPQEEWLDRRAHRSLTQWYGDTRVMLHVRSEDPPARQQPQTWRFGDDISLIGYSMPSVVVTPATALPLRLEWQALTPPRQDYTVFYHLLSPTGEVVAGQDSPPVEGLAPTSRWLPGQRTTDLKGLLIPPALPPGDYSVEFGLYHQSTGARLPVSTANGTPVGDHLQLRPIIIEARQDARPRPAHLVSDWPAGALSLIGYSTSADIWQPQEIIPVPTAGESTGLTLQASSLAADGSLSVRLYWRAGATAPASLNVHVWLLDNRGRIVASNRHTPGSHAASDAWPPGAVIVDEFKLAPAALGSYELRAALDTGESPVAPERGHHLGWVRLW